MNAEFEGVGNHLDLEALGAARGRVGGGVGRGGRRQRDAHAGEKQKLHYRETGWRKEGFNRKGCRLTDEDSPSLIFITPCDS